MSLYAYNGFVLGQLPSWDNSLSYAAIVYRENVQSREIMLICSDSELKYDPDNGLKVPAGTTIQRCPLIDGVMSWHTYSAETMANTAYYSTPIWANYDLKTTENAAYISASEPVPFDQITTDKTWVKVSGEKLPEFPTSEAYPYTYVVYSLELDGYLMIRSKNPAYVDLDIDATTVYFQEGYIVSKYLPIYGKAYWDSFVTPRQVAGGMADYSDILWHSVINTVVGLPYYEASTAPIPWPKFDLKTFCAFLAAGLCMPPIPKGARVPIAYSYNGVILPKLPEWDRETYPYVFIARAWTGTYTAVATSEANAYVYDGKTSECIGYEIPALRIYYTAPYGSTEYSWDNWSEETRSSNIALEDSPFAWANYDIKKDNILWLEASEPIPVYE